MAIRLGFQGQLNYKPGGIAAGGSWAELTNCKDVTLSLDSESDDVTTRGSDGLKAEEPTLHTAEVEFESEWDPNDAGLTALMNAYLNRSIVGIQALDYDTAPNRIGLQCDMKVHRFQRSEAQTGSIKVSVLLKPCYSATPWTWVTV